MGAGAGHRDRLAAGERRLGHGFAPEAARAAAGFAFGELGLEAIVSSTAVRNVRSRAVMERLGMTRDPAVDFEFVGFPAGHALRPHVTHRSAREAWAARSAAS